MAGIWVGAAAVFTVTTALAIVSLARGRAARRLNAAADAYAEREIAQTRRGAAPMRVRTSSHLSSTLK